VGFSPGNRRHNTQGLSPGALRLNPPNAGYRIFGPGNGMARRYDPLEEPFTNSAAILVPIGDPIPLHGSGPTAAL
jgi:hypothetical protein